MVVHTQARNCGLVGLQISNEQAREFFPPETTHIEIQLDDLRILCPLPPSFWQDRPEIRDFRLSAWLESKRTSGKLARGAAELALVPTGTGTFRLLPIPPEAALEPRLPITWMA